MYRKCIKRVLDFLLSLIALIVLSPVLILVAIWVKIDSPGKVFFRQKRVGKDKKFFQIFKFRSMFSTTPGDVPTHKLSEATSYITRSGAILRKTSLDELPQLLNILRGDMSIVGPRPALWNQDDLIAERDKYGANAVRPGLTGLAQINGRDELPIPVKAKLDGDYVSNITFLGDLRCILGTIGTVVRHEGYVEGTKEETKEGTKEGKEEDSKAAPENKD